MAASTPSAPRRLRSPMLVDPGEFQRATADLSMREIGGATILAAEFWRDGVLPAEPVELARVLGIRAAAAVDLRDRVAPLFEPSGLFGMLRAAAVAKANRRARSAAATNRVRWGHGPFLAH